jgi:hypothetical protein
MQCFVYALPLMFLAIRLQDSTPSANDSSASVDIRGEVFGHQTTRSFIDLFISTAPSPSIIARRFRYTTSTSMSFAALHGDVNIVVRQVMNPNVAEERLVV